MAAGKNDAGRKGSEHALLAIPFGSLAFLLAGLFLAWEPPIRFDADRLFRHPYVTLWASLLALQVAVWAVVGPTAGLRVGQLGSALRGKRAALAGYAATVTLPITLLFLVGLFGHRVFPLRDYEDWPLQFQRAKVVVLTVVGFVTLLAIVVAMVAVERTVTWRVETDPRPVRRYLELEAELQRHLWTGSIVVGLATLSTGVLQATMAERNDLSDWETRGRLVTVLYGGFASLLIAFVYFPVLASVRTTGVRLRDALLAGKAQPANAAAWIQWGEQRDELEELLRLRLGPAAAIKETLAVIAPLVGSALATLAGLGA